MEIKTNILKITNRFWFWYIVAGLIATISYRSIVELLASQYIIFQVHVGDPATYIFIFVIYGGWFSAFYTKRWGHGKMGLRGNILLFAGAFIILLILVYVFGYNFWFLRKG
jgi:cobalamin biosynthesis protein CobD/CbiB